MVEGTSARSRGSSSQTQASLDIDADAHQSPNRVGATVSAHHQDQWWGRLPARSRPPARPGCPHHRAGG